MDKVIIMSFESLMGIEEKTSGRIVSYAIFALWIIMFIMDAIAYSIYYQSEDIRRNLYLRDLLGVQAQIFFAQAIAGILWFIVSVYIFYSALFVEKREKYNIVGGLLFLISGIAELVLSVYLMMLRQTILEYQMKFPLISREHFINTFMDMQETLILIATLSGMIISGSIGGAFILIGMSIKKFVKEILYNIQMIKIGNLPTHQGEDQVLFSLPQEFRAQQQLQYLSPEMQILLYMENGAKKMNSGANLYIISGILDFVSLLMPGLATFSFILFIFGAMYVGSGQKMVNQARKQMMSMPLGSPTSLKEEAGEEGDKHEEQ